MEIHQLRSVVAVAETGSFTRAAERCDITQPSLSQQIKILEAELGHKLFHRLGRRTAPTEAGKVFLDRARKILFEVENATKELRDSPGLGRTIVVGATPTCAPFLLPRVLERCFVEHPGLVVHTREDFYDGLLDGITAGELDLALMSMPVRDPKVHVEEIYSEPLRLVIRANHPLASKHVVSVNDLVDEPFLFLGASNSLTSQIHRFFGDHNFTPHVNHRCTQVQTVKALVAAGRGITILPQMAAEPADVGRLAYLDLAERTPQRDLALVRHQLRFQSRGAQQFIAVLKETLKEFGQSA